MGCCESETTQGSMARRQARIGALSSAKRVNIRGAELDLMIITDEEIWNQVNKIWTENNAKKQDNLKMERIEPHIKEYCEKFLKDDFESAGEEILKEILAGMVYDDEGAISR